MSRLFRDFFVLVAIVSLLAIYFSTTGCASSGLYQMSDEWCAVHPSAGAARCAKAVLANATTYCQYGGHPGDLACGSWDQANLKRNDAGCPTAIFIAPGGNLKQCL